MINANWSAWHILAIALSISVIFLTYYIILILLQVRNTLRTLEKTLMTLENDIVPIINNVEGITGNFEQITGKADSFAGDVQVRASQTLEIVDNLKNMLNIFKYTLFVFLNKFAVFSKNIGIEIQLGVRNNLNNKNSQDNNKVSKNIDIIDHMK